MSKEDEVAIDATKAPLMDIWSSSAAADLVARPRSPSPSPSASISRGDSTISCSGPIGARPAVDTPIEMIYTAPQEFFSRR